MESRWTSWELYNFVLIGLTNELIELGVSADIKVTVLQLWARYLGKLEVAFVSTEKKLIPKLARRYQKRSLYIVYQPFISKIFCNDEIFINVFLLFISFSSGILEIFVKINCS